MPSSISTKGGYDFDMYDSWCGDSRYSLSRS
jgi:hypothetical protein